VEDALELIVRFSSGNLYFSLTQEVVLEDNSQSLIGIGRSALKDAVPVAP